MRNGQNRSPESPEAHRHSRPTGWVPALHRYLGMLGVGAPQVRTSPSAEVGLVALRLMDPPPAQVLPEVDVERPQAAVVLNISTGRLGGFFTTFTH